MNWANQEEIAEYWAKLSAGGREGVCGWPTDKYCLSWQVVPADLDALRRAHRGEESAVGAGR